MQMKKKYSIWSNIKFIAKVAGNVDKGMLPVFFVLSLLTIAVSLLEVFMIPQVLKAFISGKELSEIIRVILYMGIPWFLADGGLGYLRTIFQAKKIYFRIELLEQILLKTLRMSYPLTFSKEVGSLKEKAIKSMNNNSSKAEMIWGYGIQIISYTCLISIYLLILSSLPLLLIVLTVITTFVSFYFGKGLRQWEYDNREIQGKYLQRIYYLFRFSDNYQNIKDIRLFGLGEWLEDLLRSSMRLYHDFCYQAGIKAILADSIDVLFQLLRNALTYYYLISMVIHGQVDVAGFLLYFQVQGKFAADMSQLLLAVNFFYASHLEISTARQFLEYPELFCFENGKEIMVDKENLQIELRNVSFRYTEDGENILENINFKMSAGEKISVVGLNGAGKTTFIKLICGLLDPSEGEVLLNGINIKEFNRRQYYRLFAAVFQEHSILAGKLSWNIANSMEEIDEKRLERAISLADLADKVSGLKAGVDTYIMKEVYDDAPEFSGGEMQKILLARAIYRDSPILILDEPTAALDAIAEKAIYEKYNELTKGTMSLFISHRLASTQFCDYIVLIENKGIAEKGTHQELMNLNGRYRYLYDVQSKYYREEVVA
ncbi:ABC transporter ATP-binding protein [Clostridiales bacterium COT073_COT-073]|nr:ABC transporter ATP-binding protein [Clostridiales bacterium COT073_COT-073]